MTMFGSQWFAAPDTTYEIDQSIRFNDDDSAYLTRTPGSAGDQRTFTLSTWVKFSTIKSDNVLFSSWIASGASAYALVYIDSSFRLRFEDQNNTKLITNRVFRDIAAWYHVVIRVDTTDGTSGDRYQMYINGERQTDFATETQPSQNYQTNINKAQPHYLGRNGYSLAMIYSDLYQAETHFIDGTALAASSFGETNADGVWIPKAYGGSYGTQGFYLKGQDSSALGDDSSGNGNDFTSSGLAAADQMSDSPTDNFCVLSPIDKSSAITLSDGNLVATDPSTNSWNHGRGTIFASSGKWYYEWTPTAGSYALAGWMTDVGGNDHVEEEDDPDTTYYRGVGTGGRGVRIGDGSLDTGPANFSLNDVVMMAIDIDTMKFWVGVDGTWYNSGDPAAGSNATGTWSARLGYAIAPWYGCFLNTSETFNFGQSSFAHTIPTGFNPWSTAGLPAPSIKDGSAYFQPKIYTGSTSAQDITFSGNSDLPPDWLWFKARISSDHFVFDKLRGVLKTISTNDKTAEVTSTGSMTAFGTDGFSLGDGGSDNDINGVDGTNYVVWGWAANGSGSSNEDGSINTTATSANTTAGFSISTYTGTGSGATVGHGLGVKPSVVLVKCFGTASTHWIINDWSGDYSNKLKLNENEAASSSSGFVTAASSTTFTLGTDTDVNGSSRTYVAYCFAEIDGYSKISSYTGNNNADGPFVFTGFAPAYVLWKNRSTAGNHWVVADRARSPGNVSVERLFPDLTNAESTSTAMCDFLSNGFKIRSTMGEINTSGDTIIYMAFAENPFGGSGLAPATAR